MNYDIDNWNNFKIVTNKQKEYYLFDLINFLKTLEENIFLKYFRTFFILKFLNFTPFFKFIT